MKTKVIILLAVSAVVTLSFTFASVNAPDKQEAVTTSSKVADAPAGGFVTDKF